MSDTERGPSKTNWIGVDLDGTLATYDTWRGIDHVGTPIPAMVKRVKRWLKAGWRVKIVTARAAERNALVILTIENWCMKVFGVQLEITSQKDFGMVELWDDRAIAVESNTGRKLGGRSRIAA